MPADAAGPSRLAAAARWAVALGVSAAGLWLALRGTDWNAMTEAARGYRSPAWLLLFVPAAAADFGLRSVRWQILLAPMSRQPFRAVFPVTAAAFFTNNVLPFRAGELARVVWTSQRAQVPLSSCVAVLAVDRVFDMVSLLALVFVVLLNKPEFFAARGLLWVMGAGVPAALAGAVLMARYPEAFKRWTARCPAGVARRLDEFIEGSRALRDGRAFALALGISLLFWFGYAALMTLMLNAFSIEASFIDAAWVQVAICFAVALPSAPGFVGTFEAAGVAALGMLGLDRNAALPFVLLYHFALILGVAAVGVPSLLVAGLRWGGNGKKAP